VTLASVHASPSLAEPDAYGWTGARPTPRHGGGDSRFVGDRAWDADYLLSTLATMARETPVLAAGDFNESRTDDFDEATHRRRGTWGKEYFDRAEDVGFTDCVLRACGEERPTRGRLQLDHVLASGRAAQLVIKDPKPQVDGTWSASAQRLSDHAALWFNLVDGL
jgi:endonuclease/exonuclease/phosphatase family metal-dependent hydrolase